MKVFKEIMYGINKTIGCLWFGMAIGYIVNEHYNTALVLLFITNVLFMVGYFIEKWNK